MCVQRRRQSARRALTYIPLERYQLSRSNKLREAAGGLPAGARLFRITITPLAILTVLGCGSGLLPSEGQENKTTFNLSTLGIDEDSMYYEDAFNDVLERADHVELSDGSKVIRGSIDADDDVDVFDLGPVEPGDRLVVTMATEGALNGAIALFDENESALLVNDHRNVYLGRTQPFVDVVIHRTSQSCMVAAAATPGFNTDGDYTLVASKESGVPIPDTHPDVVLLVFDGGESVVIGNRPVVEVPPFDAADILPGYEGSTSLMMDEIAARVREDFEGFSVTILSTHEGFVDDGSMTRVFFGTYDSALLGVAEGIDEFNATPSQDAIVFTDTFEAFSALNPSGDRMAQAIANVTSHEIGHLLGLIHTEDSLGIMDVTASLSELLEDQTFRKSPIHHDAFPLGLQNATQMLLDSVGGDPLVVFAKQNRRYIRAKAFSGLSGPPAREGGVWSSCQLKCQVSTNDKRQK